MRNTPGIGRQERWINALTARRGLEDRDHLAKPGEPGQETRRSSAVKGMREPSGMQVRVVACNPIGRLHASIINLSNLDSDQSTWGTHFVKKAP